VSERLTPTAYANFDGVKVRQRARPDAAETRKPLAKDEAIEVVYQVLGTDGRIYWVTTNRNRILAREARSPDWDAALAQARHDQRRDGHGPRHGGRRGLSARGDQRSAIHNQIHHLIGDDIAVSLKGRPLTRNRDTNEDFATTKPEKEGVFALIEEYCGHDRWRTIRPLKQRSAAITHQPKFGGTLLAEPPFGKDGAL
jgi:hypothetical protein